MAQARTKIPRFARDDNARLSDSVRKRAYCGLDESCAGAERVAGATGVVVVVGGPGSALCDAGLKDSGCEAAGSVVMALSGFNR